MVIAVGAATAPWLLWANKKQQEGLYTALGRQCPAVLEKQKWGYTGDSVSHANLRILSSFAGAMQPKGQFSPEGVTKGMGCRLYPGEAQRAGL